jgi:HPr kinase/phosphorylase
MPSSNDADRRQISVKSFIDRASPYFNISVLTAENSLDNYFLDSPRVQKLGLALSGFAGKIHSGRIQIFGNSERSYLARLSSDEQARAFTGLDRENISCILITANIEPSSDLLAFAILHQIPLLKTGIPSSEAIGAIADVLEAALAPTLTTHGVLMEIYGVGVLLIGESGIGKSECALDLIGRGHRLISDDMVVLRRVGDRILGEAPELTRDHLEIRGLGIINARELFGVSALAATAEIGLCIEFAGLDDTVGSDRLGLEAGSYAPLDSGIPKYTIPVSPGRNLATLAEVAVRVFVSRKSGTGSIDDLLNRHDAALSGSGKT